jgi:hypothetical protein
MGWCEAAAVDRRISDQRTAVGVVGLVEVTVSVPLSMLPE